MDPLFIASRKYEAKDKVKPEVKAAKVITTSGGYKRSYWSSGGDRDDTCGGCGYRDTNCRCYCSSWY